MHTFARILPNAFGQEQEHGEECGERHWGAGGGERGDIERERERGRGERKGKGGRATSCCTGFAMLYDGRAWLICDVLHECVNLRSNMSARSTSNKVRTQDTHHRIFNCIESQDR
jgi:hypothetical protein